MTGIGRRRLELRVCRFGQVPISAGDPNELAVDFELSAGSARRWLDGQRT